MFHKISKIEIKNNYIIIATFENGIKKEYDISNLIEKIDEFKDLKNYNLFKLVKVDQGGYGIIWNENIDLSSEEIWKNGKVID